MRLMWLIVFHISSSSLWYKLLNSFNCSFSIAWNEQSYPSCTTDSNFTAFIVFQDYVNAVNTYFDDLFWHLGRRQTLPPTVDENKIVKRVVEYTLMSHNISCRPCNPTPTIQPTISLLFVITVSIRVILTANGHYAQDEENCRNDKSSTAQGLII